jgi:zinc protease
MGIDVRGMVAVIMLSASLLFSPPLSAGPQIDSWTTDNGARVLFVAAPDLPMVDIRVVFDAGSARDGGKAGLARLTNAMLTEGAGEWSADQIAERMESVGAGLDSGSLRDMSWVSVRSLTEDRALEVSVETLEAILSRPTFGGDALERIRQMMLAALRQGEQSPGRVANKRFMRELYGDHPYAIHSGGSAESLQAMSRNDLQQFHASHYAAKNAVVAIVGALKRDAAAKLANRITASLAAGKHAPDLPVVTPPQQGREQHIPFPSSQSHILVGQPGIKRGDPDHFPLYVGNHILGGSGLTARLSEEVREKRGLSYSVYSYFSPMRQAGPFVLGAQTKNTQAEETLQVMLETLEKFIKEGPTEQELTASKQNITGGFPLRISSNGQIVEYLTLLGFYNMPLDYLDRFVGRVNAVTAEQIRDAFQRRVDPDRLLTVIVGDEGKSSGAEE